MVQFSFVLVLLGVTWIQNIKSLVNPVSYSHLSRSMCVFGGGGGIIIKYVAHCAVMKGVLVVTFKKTSDLPDLYQLQLSLWPVLLSGRTVSFIACPLKTCSRPVSLNRREYYNKQVLMMRKGLFQERDCRCHSFHALFIAHCGVFFHHLFAH